MRELTVGEFEYVRRDYTPKYRGGPAGHGWVRHYHGRRNEVGLEARILIDEVVRLRACLTDSCGREGCEGDTT